MTDPPSHIPTSVPPAPPAAPLSLSKQAYSGLVGQKSRLGPQLEDDMTATMPASPQTDRNHFIHPMMGSPAYLCQADVRLAPTRSL